MFSKKSVLRKTLLALAAAGTLLAALPSQAHERDYPSPWCGDSWHGDYRHDRWHGDRRDARWDRRDHGWRDRDAYDYHRGDWRDRDDRDDRHGDQDRRWH